MPISSHAVNPVRPPVGDTPPPVVVQPVRRHPRDTATQDTSRTSGDHELAAYYRLALRQSTGGYDDKKINVQPIPAHSTFGQWWTQLGRAFKSPDVQQWLKEVGVMPDSIKINPHSGRITYTLYRHLDPRQTVRTVGQDDPRWAAVSAPIMAAGRVIAGDYQFSTFAPALSEDSSSAPLWLVQRFYRDPGRTTAQVEQSPSFPDLPMAYFEALHAARSEDELQAQKALLADIRTRHTAANVLDYLHERLKSGTETAEEIANYLQRTPLLLDPDSTSAAALGNSASVTLKHYLEDSGLDLPATAHQVQGLIDALRRPPRNAPTHGDYGGALSWPQGLDKTSERQLQADLHYGKFGQLDVSGYKNVLEYLLHHHAFAPSQFKHPRTLIDALVRSPKGVALGKAIQASFEARAVKGSATDWLMAALSLDHQTPRETQRYWVAGFPLTANNHAAKTATTLVDELVAHLVNKGTSSSPEKARLRAHLMLSTRAPEWLVKDIPDGVTFGSHSWVSFATAVGRIEAQAPGATANMTYGQIMLDAETPPVHAHERQVEYLAQEQALRTWASVNGMGTPQTEPQMAAVRTAYDAQMRELKAASQAQAEPMPNARELALERLKKALPHLSPALFDNKCITLSPENEHLPGPYSVLDLYLDERALTSTPADSRWVSSSDEVTISAVLPALKTLPAISTTFKPAIKRYFEQVEKSSATQVKHLISKLPLADRQHLEYGKLTVVKEMQVVHEAFSKIKSTRPVSESKNLLVKTELHGQVHTYEIDLKHNSIKRRDDLGNFRVGVHEDNTGREFPQVVPPGPYRAGLTDEEPSINAVPNSFSSERTAYIADAVVQALDIDTLKKEAEALTTFDTEVPFYKKATEFMLNLIPLRSAIKNFAAGNIGDGIVDLTFDAFGFAMGLGAAAKGGKALHSGVSAFARAGQALKIVGRATLGALNPLSGLDDLARGVVTVGRRAVTGARNGFKHLHGALTKVDPVALAKQPNIAQGTLKGATAAQDVSLFAKFDDATGNWHAIDMKTRQPYGRPLENFRPDEVSSDILSHNVQALFAKQGSPVQVCYDNAVMVAAAHNTLPLKTRTTLLANLKGQPSNYTPRYKELMGITADSTSGVFDPSKITESGIINFVSKGEDGRMVHTAYIHKTGDNQLFIYNVNQPVLDGQLVKTTETVRQCGGGLVHSLDNDGLQKFLDKGYEYAFTPNSIINANVQRLGA